MRLQSIRVVVGIPCLLRGGTEKQSSHLIKALRDIGAEVTLCCYFERDPEVVAEFAGYGIDVQTLNLKRAIGGWRLTNVLRHVFAMRNPLVTHVQYMAPGFLPVLAARLARVSRVIATVHQPASAYGFKAKFILRAAAHMCDRFICVSKAVERSWFGSSHLYRAGRDRQVSGRSSSKHCTIHNAIDLAEIDSIHASGENDNLRAQLGWETGFVIGAVSRLRREKGIDLLLDAFARVLRQVSAARLLIVGNGPDRETLMEQSRELGVEAAVFWTGEQPWADANRLIGVMDAVVVPSRFEGFGLVAAEAMACGKPVIASDVDGLSEVIGSNKFGVLVPPENPAGLANAIIGLWRSPERRTSLALAGRQRVEDAFSFHRYRTHILALYKELIA